MRDLSRRAFLRSVQRPLLAGALATGSLWGANSAFARVGEPEPASGTGGDEDDFVIVDGWVLKRSDLRG